MAKYVGENSLSELVTKTKNLVATKQDTLPAKGSTTKPIYVSSAGTIAEASTYAGGTAVTLNGTSKASSTASFYAPTNSPTATTAQRYLLGSSSTLSISTLNTNGSCFMQNGKLYSDSSEVLTINSGLTYYTTEPTAANTNGLKICVLSSEPSTKYSGWLYLIKES